jgi:hypothetical protein
MKVLLACAAVLCGAALAHRGVDVSTKVAAEDFKCLRKNGYDFAIIRCWEVRQSLGPPTLVPCLYDPSRLLLRSPMEIRIQVALIPSKLRGRLT